MRGTPHGSATPAVGERSVVVVEVVRLIVAPNESLPVAAHAAASRQAPRATSPKETTCAVVTPMTNRALQVVIPPLPAAASSIRLWQTTGMANHALFPAPKTSFRTGSVQTNWMRIPDMPNMIQVATNPAATAPATRNRSAKALLTPCAIMITRAPDARCESTKNTASQ